MVDKWPLLEEKEGYASVPFNVLEKTYRIPKKNTEFTAHVLKIPNWANIIAQNEDGHILLIRQFRFGTDKIEVEIPGGCLEAEEDPMHGAKRELLEETGYIAKIWHQIGVVDANPAIQTNKCYTFYCSELEATGKTDFDENEDIEYFFVSKDEVDTFIKEGVITNTYIIAAFYWFEKFR